MASIIVHGFPGSTYVQIVRLVLAHKAVEFEFRDLETEMNTAAHRDLHPFEYVPILQHGHFVLYETSAIVGYIDDAFPDPRLTPESIQQRAKMNQWISAVNSYYYPQIVFHLSHERSVFPALGIEPDERVVQVALPKIERALDVMESELTGRSFLVGGEVTLADLFMVPCMTSLARTEEGRVMLERHPLVAAWRDRMEQLPSVQRFRAAQPPRKPIEHARRWVKTHRPGILAYLFNVGGAPRSLSMPLKTVGYIELPEHRRSDSAQRRGAEPGQPPSGCRFHTRCWKAQAPLRGGITTAAR